MLKKQTSTNYNFAFTIVLLSLHSKFSLQCNQNLEWKHGNSTRHFSHHATTVKQAVLTLDRGRTDILLHYVIGYCISTILTIGKQLTPVVEQLAAYICLKANANY